MESCEVSERVCAASLSDYYEWPSGITLQIQCRQPPKSLQRELGAFRVQSESHRSADARIVYCRQSGEMPLSGETQNGRYKGMPWNIVRGVSSKGEAVYFFFAPFFSTFLFVRICLIPILKKTVIEKGGFMLIGSAFTRQNILYILSGKPGSGKTRLLLEMLNTGGRFLGDSELMLTADKKVYPVFAYLEARLKTLYGTASWHSLSWKRKGYLWFCHLVSVMTLRRISFNLLLDSVDSKKIPRPRSTEQVITRGCLIHLQNDAADILSLTAQDYAEVVKRYERDYQSLFGEGIYTEALLRQGLNQLKALLAEVSLWKVPTRERAYLFLTQGNLL